MQKINIKDGPKIEDYKAYGSLFNLVNEFLATTKKSVADLKGCTIWMINSTATGGGVAEMLPSQIRIMRSLGVKIEWMVIEASDELFFNLTKRIHNAIHGSGDGIFTDEDRAIFEQTNAQNADRAIAAIGDGDLVVIHDPQPMPLAAMIAKKRNVKMVWRCHIGLEEQNKTTRGVWSFLSRYFDSYDHFVFSLPTYVPEELKEKTTIITPAIDPLSHKNRTLHTDKCISILLQAGIVNGREPLLFGFYDHQARRVMPDGSFNTVNHNSNLDLIYRPTVTEISRWDRLKGFKELMNAFITMKRENEATADSSSIPYKRIKAARLVLGGPDPAFVSDDPEGEEVLNELIEQYRTIDPELQEDIAILLLPLDNPKENALIVNALQRFSNIIVQNSIQEGFGLTATEAMWKQRPVLVSGAAGLRFQVQHNINGKINEDPTDITRLAKIMKMMINSPKERDKWGFNGQIRVIGNFTLFSQISSWLSVLSKIR
jgi:trehalose synthase